MELHRWLVFAVEVAGWVTTALFVVLVLAALILPWQKGRLGLRGSGRPPRGGRAHSERVGLSR